MSEPTINKMDIIRRMKEGEALYVLISLCTKCPYVVCDPETFDDKVFVYFDMEDAKKEWERLRQEKIPVNVAKLETKQFLYFYTSLYTLGINAIAVKDGEKELLVQLNEVVMRADPKNQPEGHVWVENPQLHLTALYLMQEVRRNPEAIKTQEMKDLQEEIGADFNKGKYIQPVQKEGSGIPLLKMAQGEKYQPIFTDILEFQKFNKGGQLRPLVIEAAKVPQILAPEACGVVINPLGINLPMKINRPAAAGAGAPAAAAAKAAAAAGAKAPAADAAKADGQKNN